MYRSALTLPWFHMTLSVQGVKETLTTIITKYSHNNIAYRMLYSLLSLIAGICLLQL